MKGKLSPENYPDQSRNDNTPVDQSIISDNTTDMYSPEEQRLPEREAKTWCSYMEREYRASRIMTGTQTGSHAADPAHSFDEEMSKDKLLPEFFKKKAYNANTPD